MDDEHADFLGRLQTNGAAATIAEMIEVLDKTPLVKRYAIYNWEDVRNMQRKDGSLPPAGEAYPDAGSPVGYRLPQTESPRER